mgnify:CR=1 FL=1
MVCLKSCQRCGGDLYKETNQFGSYVSCFQCGSSVVEPEAGTAFGDVVESLDMMVAQVKCA